MDVLKEIKKEHDEFRKLIREIEKLEGEDKRIAFIELYSKLKGHHYAEEKVVFPHVKARAKAEDKETILEMVEEHNLGSYQLSLLDRTSLESETWSAKFSVLKEILTHHMDEEEDKFFKLADFVLNDQERKSLYDEFEKNMKKGKERQEKKLTKDL